MKSGTNRWLAALGVFTVLMSGLAHSQNGALDREAEVGHFSEQIASGTRIVLTQAAKDIYASDLADARLAALLYAKLQATRPSLSDRSAVDMQYQRAMIVALASFGIADYEPELRAMCATIKPHKKLNYCDEELVKVSWHRQKNQVAASALYHRSGDDPKIARLLNLLMADDFSFKSLAGERILVGKLFEPRLLDAIASQVLQFMDSTGHGAQRAKTEAVALYVRVLGNSNDTKYRDVIDKVLASHASTAVMQHAREAQKRLHR